MFRLLTDSLVSDQTRVWCCDDLSEVWVNHQLCKSWEKILKNLQIYYSPFPIVQTLPFPNRSLSEIKRRIGSLSIEKTFKHQLLQKQNLIEAPYSTGLLLNKRYFMHAATTSHSFIHKHAFMRALWQKFSIKMESRPTYQYSLQCENRLRPLRSRILNYWEFITSYAGKTSMSEWKNHPNILERMWRRPGVQWMPSGVCT